MTSDQSIITQITQTLNASLEGWFGAGFRLSGEQPERMDRSYTVILNYIAVGPDEEQIPLILKLPREKRMGTLQEIISDEDIRTVAIQRTEILQGIEKAVAESGNSNLTAIKIYGVFSEFCAIVMEWREFTTFKRLYFQRPVYLSHKRFFDTVDRDNYIAGQWVRLWHESFLHPGDQTTQQLRVNETVNEMLGQIEDLTGSQYQELRQRFSDTHDLIKDTPNPISSLHNDLTFNNLFVSDDGRIGGFDPTPEPPGSIYQDLARLLTFCATSNQQVATQGLYFGKWYPHQVESSFLRGYGPNIEKDMLNFFCARLVLEKWLEFEVEDLYQKSILTSLPGARSMFRPLINRYFHNLILHYLTR
jgi:hypothetical protein